MNLNDYFQLPMYTPRNAGRIQVIGENFHVQESHTDFGSSKNTPLSNIVTIIVAERYLLYLWEGSVLSVFYP